MVTGLAAMWTAAGLLIATCGSPASQGAPFRF